MKKRKTIIAAIILLLILIIGGAIAYFTDKDTATNTFTIGDVEIEVVESQWSKTDADNDDVPDAAQDRMPGQTVTKDPKIHNKSAANSAYVFMKVVSPCSTGEVVDGNPTPVRELFTYTANSGWYLMTPSNSCQGGSVTRIYAYGTETTMTELAAEDANSTNDDTTTLFNNVLVNPNLDGSEKGITGKLNMVITGYAIQKDGITATSPSQVWTTAQFS